MRSCGVALLLWAALPGAGSITLPQFQSDITGALRAWRLVPPAHARYAAWCSWDAVSIVLSLDIINRHVSQHATTAPMKP